MKTLSTLMLMALMTLVIILITSQNTYAQFEICKQCTQTLTGCEISYFVNTDPGECGGFSICICEGIIIGTGCYCVNYCGPLCDVPEEGLGVNIDSPEKLNLATFVSTEEITSDSFYNSKKSAKVGNNYNNKVLYDMEHNYIYIINDDMTYHKYQYESLDAPIMLARCGPLSTIKISLSQQI